MDEAHVLQCVYNQSVFLFAFNAQQLPPLASPTRHPWSPASTRTRTSTPAPSWSVCSPSSGQLMDQQFRMLPGLFDPAREAFYRKRNIEDVVNPDADSSIAHSTEMWFMHKAQGCLRPPLGKYWPVFVNTPGTHCVEVPDSKSSINEEMWKTFFDKVLWPDFLSPTLQHRVDWGRLCILNPRLSRDDEPYPRVPLQARSRQPQHTNSHPVSG